MRSISLALVMGVVLIASGCGDDSGIGDGGGAMDADRADTGGMMDAQAGDSGSVMDALPPTPDGETCTPTTCAAEGADCGMLADGCDGVLECGSCTAPETCGGDGMANRCGEGSCTPTTCAAAGAECGMISDGCGGVLSCGSCAAPETCGGGGVPNQCGGGGMGMAQVRLRFGMLSGTYLDVIMENDVEVAGFQFDVTGMTLTGAEGGRASMGGFSSASTATRVLAFSTTGARMAPEPAGSLLVRLKLNPVPSMGIEGCIIAPVFSDGAGLSIPTSVGPCFAF